MNCSETKHNDSKVDIEFDKVKKNILKELLALHKVTKEVESAAKNNSIFKEKNEEIMVLGGLM